MRYIYILGLEHSGTTLLDYSLSQQENTLGLGEVTQFFDQAHMRRYMDQWGSHDDVRRCSCGSDWQNCAFWSTRIKLTGLNSDKSLIHKYKELLTSIESEFGKQVTVIDSSKRLDTLLEIEQNIDTLPITKKDLQIVCAVKDVRSFAMSISRKSSKLSLLSVIRSFNWWVKENTKYLALVSNQNSQAIISLYEKFCDKPEQQLAKMATIVTMERAVGSSHDSDYDDKVPSKKVSTKKAPRKKAPRKLDALGSHIAMGNKNFTVRNLNHITYDNAWQNNWRIKLVYLLHWKARRLNNVIYTKAL